MPDQIFTFSLYIEKHLLAFASQAQCRCVYYEQ